MIRFFHEWVLIMTLFMGNGGVAIETHEFLGKESCEQAGIAWKTSTPKRFIPVTASYICIPKNYKHILED